MCSCRPVLRRGLARADIAMGGNPGTVRDQEIRNSENGPKGLRGCRALGRASARVKGWDHSRRSAGRGIFGWRARSQTICVGGLSESWYARAVGRQVKNPPYSGAVCGPEREARISRHHGKTPLRVALQYAKDGQETGWGSRLVEMQPVRARPLGGDQGAKETKRAEARDTTPSRVAVSLDLSGRRFPATGGVGGGCGRRGIPLGQRKTSPPHGPSLAYKERAPAEPRDPL